MFKRMMFAISLLLASGTALADVHVMACEPVWAAVAKQIGGDRVDEFSFRAAGAGYEELHARGGGILSTVRATRGEGEDGLRTIVERHRGWMLRHGTTTFEAQSGYRLDRGTELAKELGDTVVAVGGGGRHFSAGSGNDNDAGFAAFGDEHGRQAGGAGRS